MDTLPDKSPGTGKVHSGTLAKKHFIILRGMFKMNKKLTAAAILAAMTLAATTSAFAATPEDEIKELKARIAKLESSMTTVEKKQSAPQTKPNITITGESRIRYQWGDEGTAVDGTNAFDLRQRLYLGAKINDHVSYTGRLEATFKNGDSATGTTRFNQNYFTITDVGVDKMLIGRVPAAAGMNLNVGKPSDNDGIIVVEKAGDVTFTAFALEEGANTQFNGIYAGMSLSKDVDVALGYTRGDADDKAQSFDIGAAYTFGKDYTLVGEYVDTDNDNLSDADAWAVQLVKGVTTKKVGTLSTNMSIVDKNKAHTEGYIIGYRHIEDNGLWNDAKASPFNANNNVWTTTDNTKGFYLGYQNVLAKNTILTLEYQDLEQVEGTVENKVFQSHVQFFF